MSWVMLLYFSSYSGSFQTIEFRNKYLCELAQKQIYGNDLRSNPKTICIQKDGEAHLK